MNDVEFCKKGGSRKTSEEYSSRVLIITDFDVEQRLQLYRELRIPVVLFLIISIHYIHN